ncbi:MAG: hypothetical protein JWQ98_2852 [Chlorobi bacterium]|nr:hypothetical protein [Chlorobiota bacterium]
MRYLSAILLALALGTLLPGCGQPPALPSDPTDTTGTVVTDPNVGKAAPDFTESDMNGNPVSLSSTRGKVVLVDFWASWCAPCRAAMPTVRQTWETYRAKDFMILGVSLDNSLSAWKTYVAGNGMTWTQVLNGYSSKSGNTAADRYHISAIPTQFLIGRDGKIIASGNYIDDLDGKIAAALK